MSNRPDGAADATAEDGAGGRPGNPGPAVRTDRVRTPGRRSAAPRGWIAATGALALLSAAALTGAGALLAERQALSARVAALEADDAEMIARIDARHAADRAALRAEAEAETAALRAERDGWESEAAALRQRLAALAGDLTERQTRLMDAAEAEGELALALDVLRAKLRDAVAERDAAEMRRIAAEQELGETRRAAAAADAAEAEWAAVLTALNHALEDGTRERDAAERARRAAERDLAELENREARAREARERLYGQLEDALASGLTGLEGALGRAGIDVDRVVDDLRRDYSGVGGPFIPADAGDQGADAGGALHFASADAARIAALMGGLERASLMQVAAAKIPLAHPVRGAHRFTSGYGVRRDPKNGRMRMHAGADFAGPTGTPIVAPADGVVTFAGWQSGYGRVVKIRHAFGFETVYAHLNATRVSVGDRLARGDRIGDMGRTGRATGVHLHYEIRLNGRPVNPMRYIEAARNVL